MFSRTILSHLRAAPLAGRRQHQHQQELHFSWPLKKNGYKCLDTLRTTLTQGEDRTVLDRPNERYHAYRTTQSRRPRPEPAPDLLARSPDSMRQDFSLGGSFKIFGTTILSPFLSVSETPLPQFGSLALKLTHSGQCARGQLQFGSLRARAHAPRGRRGLVAAGGAGASRHACFHAT